MIVVTHCRTLGWKPCPRCWRWTPNDGPAMETKNEPGIICWRCQEILCLDYPNHPISLVVQAWRQEHGLPSSHESL